MGSVLALFLEITFTNYWAYADENSIQFLLYFLYEFNGYL